MEVLTCVNNLQSRCDILEDTSAILGCAACCSSIESTSDGLLLDNHSQKNFIYTAMLADVIDGHTFIGQMHNPSINSTTTFLPSNVVNQQLNNDIYAKRLRKRPAGFFEEETVKKNGKTNYLDSSGKSSDSHMEAGFPAQPQGDKEKSKLAKLRRAKDSLILVKVEDNKPLSKSLEPKTVDETDAKVAALEWQRCVSLLKSYGVIASPDLAVRQKENRSVPHPGCVGDGLLAKMCKICGMSEDAHNTVICDGCQEAFHLTCVPRLTSKYFRREDNWFCALCRKQRRKLVSKSGDKGSTQEENNLKEAKHNDSKVRLGPAHQADVPEWQRRALDDDAERRVEGCIGMEVPLSEEHKIAEKDHLLRSFNTKLELLGWSPADKIPCSTSQNWVKCNNIIVRGHKTSDGRKQNEIVCSKWRRAPLNVQQTDEWECFCAIEWDPLHADCAVPQECSSEEIFSRIGHQFKFNMERQSCEVGDRKSTLRHGKLVL